MLYILLCHFLFSLTFGLARGAVHISQPIFFVAIRMMLAGMVLLGWQKLHGKSIYKYFKQHQSDIVLLAIFNVFLYNAPEFWSMKFITGRKATLIYSMCPFLTALLAHRMFNEKLRAIQWLGMMVGATGFLFVFAGASPGEAATGGFGILSWPEMAMLVSALASVIGWLVLKRVSTTDRQAIIPTNGMSMFLGGFIALIVSALFESWLPTPVTNVGQFFGYLAAFIVISNIFAYTLYGWLLHRYSATLLSFTAFIQPLFAAILDVVFFGDTLHPSFFISFFTIGLGLTLFLKSEFNPPSDEVLRRDLSDLK